jgi:predicted DNA-binding transcriptional regulator AlpA
MSLDDSCLETRAPSAAFSNSVSLSKWVNEPFPAWGQLLSSHDVARLTRRPRWVLLSMMVLGRFPRKHRFHGRAIGWLRTDVLHWMAKDLRIARCCSDSAPLLRRRSNWPLGRAHEPRADRDRLGACMDSRDARAFARSARR